MGINPELSVFSHESTWSIQYQDTQTCFERLKEEQSGNKDLLKLVSSTTVVVDVDYDTAECEDIPIRFPEELKEALIEHLRRDNGENTGELFLTHVFTPLLKPLSLYISTSLDQSIHLERKRMLEEAMYKGFLSELVKGPMFKSMLQSRAYECLL